MTFECSDYISQICNSKKKTTCVFRQTEKYMMQLKNEKRQHYRHLLYITDIKIKMTVNV